MAITIQPYNILRYFEHEHLPTRLREVSKPFHELAHKLYVSLPTNPETTMALRKLLEAKDCAVRSALDLPEPEAQ